MKTIWLAPIRGSYKGKGDLRSRDAFILCFRGSKKVLGSAGVSYTLPSESKEVKAKESAIPVPSTLSPLGPALFVVPVFVSYASMIAHSGFQLPPFIDRLSE